MKAIEEIDGPRLADPAPEGQQDRASFDGGRVRQVRENTLNRSIELRAEDLRWRALPHLNGGPSSWCPRRHSLSKNRGAAPNPDMTGRVLPHSFVHDVQRALGVVCYADDCDTIFREQLDCEFAHVFHGSGQSQMSKAFALFAGEEPLTHPGGDRLP
jgi:hypothetical protein